MNDGKVLFFSRNTNYKNNKKFIDTYYFNYFNNEFIIKK